MKKRVAFLVFFLLFVSFISFASASLGISPAVGRLNFFEGETHEIEYRVRSDNPNQEIVFYVEGDLAQYVSLDKNSSIGSDSFKLTLKFPQKSDISPGNHELYVAAKEEATSQNQFIGTSITIRAIISIFVPYPGEYIDAEMNIPDVNEGEKVPVEIKVINKGTENLTVTPEVTFYDDSSKEIGRMTFNPSQINRGEMDDFRKYFYVEGIKPGSYSSEAVISFNEQKLKINKTFKIGNLYVNITNFTKNLNSGEINKFFIEIKSNWNNKIEGVFADVKLLLNGSEIVSFRTPSADLLPWENKSLEGYLDASTIKGGKYEAAISLIYGGRPSYSSGEVTVLDNPISVLWYIAGVGGLILIVAVIVAGYLAVKKMKLKRRKNETKK